MSAPGVQPRAGDQPDARVDAAFAAQPRERFLPESVRGQAALDQPLPIGFAQTNSQPTTVRDMLVLLDVHRGMKVLEVGAGTGWVLAMLAELVGVDGTAIGTERIHRLVEAGNANLVAADVPWARLVEADEHALGAPEEAPFDRILVSAMAGRMPRTLVAQLAPGGVMVAPVRMRMMRVVRGLPPHDDPDDAVVTEHGGYRFVPLIEP
ncbi:protein-L-isoaspartate carboxylmethyltransferase [Demequina sp. SYSU T00039]|uniref:Protein-L-isoaspartate O-methyltransferase n=1 Tax=Demequina lignilytica TaxID=3051663 RepID=A0AAW7M3I6_9MICO|nr:MULTISPECIES: methyltransferase domain-containing protein [unclassified Demequina]MDN4477766.1 protein-L-isoaspartate carboxylmethyltransferase [Demequina sp. SYSU T00039-1]MDN4487675.1 protein-L-isoaspartate carboxylmethyltransferase [Demequina sp. SYSU T00039]MDN4491386.1 protein-L-isoaspartate carboxylmethyltransferase [Demequina sp. SYSU T00068]